jgi:hypothetical protein
MRDIYQDLLIKIKVIVMHSYHVHTFFQFPQWNINQTKYYKIILLFLAISYRMK